MSGLKVSRNFLENDGTMLEVRRTSRFMTGAVVLLCVFYYNNKLKFQVSWKTWPSWKTMTLCWSLEDMEAHYWDWVLDLLMTISLSFKFHKNLLGFSWNMAWNRSAWGFIKLHDGGLGGWVSGIHLNLRISLGWSIRPNPNRPDPTWPWTTQIQ